jgi:hypothetical protein
MNKSILYKNYFNESAESMISANDAATLTRTSRRGDFSSLFKTAVLIQEGRYSPKLELKITSGFVERGD